MLEAPVVQLHEGQTLGKRWRKKGARPARASLCRARLRIVFPASVPKVEWKENLQPTERFCHFIEQTILLDDFSFV